MVCRFVFLAVLLVALNASSATTEDRRFQAATRKMHMGLWDQAADDFAAFVTNFPASSRVPEAILYQAEAAITNQQFGRAVELLESNLERAGSWLDAYLLWIGQAHLQNGSPAAAAERFSTLTQQFPDSTHALAGNIGQATALARMEQWSRVIELLSDPASAFQRSSGALTNPAVGHGYLLLTEAELAEGHFAAAEQSLHASMLHTLPPDLAWRRVYLQCQIDLARERPAEALANSTNLLALARGLNSPRSVGESQLLRVRAFETLSRIDEAIEVCRQLLTNAPPDHQRFALLKIAELHLAQDRAGEAITTLESFVNSHSNAPAVDMALLTLGELRLRSFLVQTNRTPALTNLLLQASNHFESVLTAFPQSALSGKALLGKGWCLWSAAQVTRNNETLRGAADTFRAAVDVLPPSEDQAVARFKLGDTLYQLRDFAGALEQYDSIGTNYHEFPAVSAKLGERALYQGARAALESTNLVAAERLLNQILERYPNGFAGDRALLLVGEGHAEHQDPESARRLFELFERLYPSSRLLPEVRLAVARTYEIQEDWTNAVAKYRDWIATFTNQHPALPVATFWMAWDTYRANDEGGALTQFTNFVARWPTNELTPKAQWWIADHYFRNGKWFEAEENYQYIKSPEKLAQEARMMAGRAAVARYAYNDAISYFSNLVANPASPVALKVKAAFPAGDACVLRTPPGATNRVEDLREAIRWFERVATLVSNSPAVPAALARSGDCYKEMGGSALDDAIKSYRAALEHTNSTVATRSQARIALGIVAEIKARNASEDAKVALLKEALKHYTDVFVFDDTLEENQKPDAFAVKEAGLKAGRVAEQLQQWNSAEQIYRRLQRLFPAVATTWDSRIQEVQRRQSGVGR